MKYERIEKIQEAKIKLFNLFNKALSMAEYDIQEDSENLRVQWAEAMLILNTGVMELETMCDEKFLKFLEKEIQNPIDK